MRTSEARFKPNLECRDPVHGFVYLSPAEWDIVDCPTFQRLRDIRQLAMAHLVYPGATHTRFEHSLGCLHLSARVFNAVRRQVDLGECPNFARAFRANEAQVERGEQVLRLAGLLHDLGHTPFSHSGEKLMPFLEIAGKRRRMQHEDMTARLIRETEIADRLEKDFGRDTVEEVIAVATGPELAELPKGDAAWYRFLNDIVSGELGSDRMDYLLRDAIHSGQSAGLFDYRKLIDSMTIVPAPEETGEEARLGLDGAGWLVGEQMVAARYLMYVALYFHKTKRIYELHLEDFLAKWLAREYGQPLFPIDVGEYARLTDSRIWAAIYETGQDPRNELRELAMPFVDRTHWRLAYELLPADNSAPWPSAGELLAQADAAARDLSPPEAISATRKLLLRSLARHRSRPWNEKRFDKLATAAQDYVRIKFGSAVRHDRTEHSAAKFFNPKNKIWVYLDGQTRYLDELSEIVSGMPDRICRGRIYAPEDIRLDVRSFCQTWLTENPCREGEIDVSA